MPLDRDAGRYQLLRPSIAGSPRFYNIEALSPQPAPGIDENATVAEDAQTRATRRYAGPFPDVAIDDVVAVQARWRRRMAPGSREAEARRAPDVCRLQHSCRGFSSSVRALGGAFA